MVSSTEGGKKMTDYSELVKKLRDLHREPRPASAEWLFENQVALYDAAAAIEALQAEIRESMQRCAECGDELAHQMPKRGEWVKGTAGLYHCSKCGKTAPYLDAFDGVIQYWEPLVDISPTEFVLLFLRKYELCKLHLVKDRMQRADCGQ
jgi:DNA-directed RNA polymerase subunit RPC12/RpoP